MFDTQLVVRAHQLTAFGCSSISAVSYKTYTEREKENDCIERAKKARERERELE